MFRFNFFGNSVAKNLRPRFGSRSTKSSTHHTAEPYAPKHHPTQPEEALAFGRKPGDPLEGWEFITFVTAASVIGLFVTGFYFDNKEDLSVITTHEIQFSVIIHVFQSLFLELGKKGSNCTPKSEGRWR